MGRNWLLGGSIGIIAGSALLLALACSSPAPTAAPPPPAPTATPTPVVLKPLKANPEKGPVGTAFTVTGEGLAPGKPVDFQWATWEGSYINTASAENVTFNERKFKETRVAIGKATADAQGRVSFSAVAPEDYGEVHDIYALVDGQPVARGGFRILRTATISPTQGPVGTPITIAVKGIAWKPYENTMGVRYDNKYTGYISAVTTRGTAVAQIRAAGPVGQRTIQLTGASPGLPYINYDQSPVAHIPGDFTWNFTVTSETPSLADSLDWPDSQRVALVSDAAPKTTGTAGVPVAQGLSALVKPTSGPILTPATLQAKGLAPNSEVELYWISARGNRLSPSGWSLVEQSVGKAAVAADGAVSAKFQVPDDLGGWHVVKLTQGGKTLAETPYFLERSMVSVTPKKVKAGEPFTVQIKGVGWTELDNGVAVTYDNAYIGYACGFNTNGDITLKLMATGGPGIHLIDFYPMIYRDGRSKAPQEYWDFQIPHLSALQDAPGLALGYKLPIFRFTVEVVD